jgi:CHAD domain-containing protein
MALDQRRIHNSARKLRKLLKETSSAPLPNDAHTFRTNAKRLETLLEKLTLDKRTMFQKLIKQISKLRRRAGKVRDCDVMTDYVSGIPRNDEDNECSVRLLEHLGAQRDRQARKFHKLLRRHSSSLRRRLKYASKVVKNTFPPKGDGRLKGNPISASVSASVLTLLSELRRPRRLRRSNLHEYRLQVKELRNLLQMAEHSDQQPFVDRLGQVKDAIGEWHDWEVLVAIAKDVLDHHRNCQLLEKLRKTALMKYENALRLSEAMRKQDLVVTKWRSRISSKLRAPGASDQVWSATASLNA